MCKIERLLVANFSERLSVADRQRHVSFHSGAINDIQDVTDGKESESFAFGVRGRDGKFDGR